MCADLTNAAFSISHPGKEFIIQAGNGDWEFFFSDDAKDVVHGRCVREGPKQFSSSKDCNSYFRNLLSWWSQSPNTDVRGPLALTCEVQEPTSNVSTLTMLMSGGKTSSDVLMVRLEGNGLLFLLTILVVHLFRLRRKKLLKLTQLMPRVLQILPTKDVPI